MSSPGKPCWLVRTVTTVVNSFVIRSHSHGPCGNYDEDTWAERLSRCFEHIGIKHKFTSKLRGHEASAEAMKSRIPRCVSMKSFLFWDSPDIIIETPNGDGIVAITDRHSYPTSVAFAINFAAFNSLISFINS